jgi:hypothetical protein
MNVFKGTLFRISQTDTRLRAIAIENLDPSAENASMGAWRLGYCLGSLGKGIDMRETKEKFTLFVPPESK